ncbi:MAG: DUF3048 domain-containing protein [Defluviitaleaceae bacterium]|nr:DUF3048 domain-containing protein [Defluviitaleaceae bacterium]
MKIFFALLTIIFILAACGRGNDAVEVFLEPSPTPAPTPFVFPSPSPTPEPEEDEEEYEEICLLPRSQLTGLVVEEEVLTRRPLAVVINNMHRALPQSGIAAADIIYEVLAEGDVTRLVAIFQSEIPLTIGPVRSARDYLVDFALNHDGIFVHHGESPNAHQRWPFLHGARIDGMHHAIAFWRDRSYPAWARNTGQRPFEHSSFTGRAQIGKHMLGISWRDYTEDAQGFYFTDEPHEEYTGIALHFTVPFSPAYARTFVFNEETGLYAVENRDGATMDALTEEAVHVRNVLIKLTQIRVIAGDAAGRRNVATIGAGDGYLFNNGTYRPVRWEKDNHAAPLRWYEIDGTPLFLLPGTTWVNVLQNTAEVRIN